MSKEEVIKLKNWLQGLPEKTTPGCKSSEISESLDIVDDRLMGRCIAAKTDIEHQTTIVKIPNKYLLNYVNILKHISFWNDDANAFLKKNIGSFNRQDYKGPPDEVTSVYSQIAFGDLIKLTSHQLIALFICLEKRRKENSFWFPMFSCFPDPSEYTGIPLTWTLFDSTTTRDQIIYDSLPDSTKSHVRCQREQLTRDIETSDTLLNQSAIKLTKEEYTWAWLSVNTRCLYFQLPGYIPITQTKGSEASNITMVPYVDYVNHQVTGNNCVAQVDKNDYAVKTTRNIGKDEHLWFTYGPHSDEFLQCEYGFATSAVNKDNAFLSFNLYNTVDLTPLVLRLLNNPKKEKVAKWLKQVGYLGDYTLGVESILDADGALRLEVQPSYRTRVALASLIENVSDYKYSDSQDAYICPSKLDKFYQGYNDGEFYMKSENMLLHKMVDKLRTNNLENLGKLAMEQQDATDNESQKIDVAKKLLYIQDFIIDNFHKNLVS